jgi:hypothetical protein
MAQPRTTFTARSPVDLIAVVPHVLGFHPSDSVVLLTFGPGETFHARVDLPDDEDGQVGVATMLRDVVAQHAVPRVALLLYTDDPWVAATFHDAVVPGLVRDEVQVIDVLRVASGRFHRACEPEDPGTAYDLRAHPFTAEQVLEGKVVHGSREELAATLEIVDPADAAAVDAAAARVADQLRGCLHLVRPDRVRRDLVRHARWVQRTVRRHARDGTALSVEDAGRLLVLVAVVGIRDVAWSQMTRSGAAGHVALWRGLVQRCPRDLLPAATALLAFAAWLDGHGALAWCALDRCEEVDPAYSMADCIRQLLEGAVPPSVWTPFAASELPVFGDATGLEVS